MRTFPLFHPYPLIGYAETRHPFDLSQDTRNIENINTPLEMLDHSFRHYNGSALISEFDRRFIEHRENMLRAGLVPYFNQVPTATKFQRSAPIIQSNLFAEIAQSGVKLASGQVIFHGGDFQIDDIPNLTSQPLSTTFKPLIAIWHAYNDGIGKWNPQLSSAPSEPQHPAILVLTVSPNFSKKSIIFRRGGPSMADEMEALLEGGCQITPQSSYIYPGYHDVEIIQATLES